MDIFKILLIYLEMVNLLALAMFGLDKHRARVRRERIPEAALLALAIVGGSIGALAGMYLFHHKTRKRRFSVGVPVILVMQIAFFLCLILAVGQEPYLL